MQDTYPRKWPSNISASNLWVDYNCYSLTNADALFRTREDGVTSQKPLDYFLRVTYIHRQGRKGG